MSHNLTRLRAYRDTLRAEGRQVPPEVTRAIDAIEAQQRDEQQRRAGLKSGDAA